ncbi:MAG: disulfide bond formation protein B [Rhodobacteraceae bacterium]|nr:disulfide bond formation protein B [Paracoccaceae bacterium]
MNQASNSAHLAAPMSTAVLAAIAAASAGALGLALISQYGFDLWPCILCYYQRVPYGVAGVLALLAMMPAVDGRSRRLVACHCAGLFVVNAGIAFFHVGVEHRWWRGPSECIGQIKDYSSTDLLAALSQAGRTGCEDPAFTFLGISMAGYNVLASLILAALCISAIRKTAWWIRP